MQKHFPFPLYAFKTFQHSVLTCIAPHLMSCAGRLSDEDCFVCETCHRGSLLPISKYEEDACKVKKQVALDKKQTGAYC